MLQGFLGQVRKCSSKLLVSGDYLDDCYYQFSFDYATKVLSLSYFFFPFDEVSILWKDDYFQVTYPEQYKPPENEEFSATF